MFVCLLDVKKQKNDDMIDDDTMTRWHDDSRIADCRLYGMYPEC